MLHALTHKHFNAGWYWDIKTDLSSFPPSSSGCHMRCSWMQKLQTWGCSYCASTIFLLCNLFLRSNWNELKVFVQSVKCVFRFAGVSGSNHHLLALLSFPVCCQPSKPEQEIHKVLILTLKSTKDFRARTKIRQFLDSSYVEKIPLSPCLFTFTSFC